MTPEIYECIFHLLTKSCSIFKALAMTFLIISFFFRKTKTEIFYEFLNLAHFTSFAMHGHARPH